MTTKKPRRVRILMMPLQEDEDSDPVGYSGPATVLTGLPRTIRRHELRLIVSLADSTIYEMEKRGGFPRRFNLTPRCVVWGLEEVEVWLEQRRQAYLAGGTKIAPGPNVRQRKTRPVKAVVD
ncbi:helix-turn-helix transcriptional regulator [Bosea sp. LjRoot237]|uniref:helix-turn-helix transcriptional regulator n=1 Tax=Bosea sp. LjRoot237 TaxID=3342292 RepID=UPI003ECD6409